MADKKKVNRNKNKRAFNREYIYICVNDIWDANTSRDRIEAFAFAVFIKNQFRSSFYKQINYKEIQIALKVGRDKSKKLVKDAIKYGYVTPLNDGLLSVKMKYIITEKTDRKLFNFKFRINNFQSLKSIVYRLKQILILDKISRLNFATHTANCEAAELDPKRIKSLRKKRQKYGVGKDNFGISYRKIGKCVNVGNRNDIVKMIDDMVRRGIIEKENCNKMLYFGSDAHYQLNSNPIYSNRKNVIIKRWGGGIVPKFMMIEIHANKFTFKDSDKYSLFCLKWKKQKSNVPAVSPSVASS